MQGKMSCLLTMSSVYMSSNARPSHVARCCAAFGIYCNSAAVFSCHATTPGSPAMLFSSYRKERPGFTLAKRYPPGLRCLTQPCGIPPVVAAHACSAITSRQVIHHHTVFLPPRHVCFRAEQNACSRLRQQRCSHTGFTCVRGNKNVHQ